MINRINDYFDNEVIRIIFNSEMLDGFTKEYKIKHPRAKKLPLDWCGKKRFGLIPTMNRFLNVSSRQQQNSMKQQFSEYTKFILKNLDVDRNYLDRCAVLVKQYYPTKAKFDLDGVCVKPSFDSMTEFGVWEDDNIYVIEPYIVTGGYDKDNPRTEIVVFPITDEYDREFVLSCMIEELIRN